MSAGPVDVLLVAGLVALAAVLLFGRDLFRAVVLFIVFGLLMALVWGRLRAPDLALAEAAVGAGVTGGLLLAAWRRIEHGPEGLGWAGTAVATGVPLALALALVAVGIVAALPPAGVAGGGLYGPVAARLAESGVAHPVTAVLLNFRGYDTLLELGVLLVAAISVRRAGAGPVGPAAPAAPADTLLEGFGALLVPVLVATAGYLLWRGAHAPGGAFQAGSILAAAGILLALVHPRRIEALPERGIRTVLVGGPVLFLVVAAAATTTGSLLEYPGAWAGALILAIEAAATLAIGMALLALFLGVATVGGGREGR